MKLITETNMNAINRIDEELDEHGKKSLFIQGIFCQAETKNRNGRIYKKSVLKHAVDEYINEYVNNRRATGELNHPSCMFNNDFKVFTPSGWVEFKDIKVGDQLYCMGIDRKLAVGNVLKKIEEPVLNEYSYHIKGRHIDSTVTENHRFYCLDRYDNVVVKTAKELYETYTNKMRIIKSFLPNLEQESEDTITIKGCEYSDCEYSKRRFKNDVRKDLVINVKDFCSFLGFWLAEGCLSKPYNIKVFQNSGSVAEEYKNILKRMGFDYTVHFSKNKKNVNETISFCDKRIYNLLKPLGNCYTKYIPEQFKNLNPKYLIEILNWFAKGDGRKVTNGSEKRKQLPLNIFSTSKHLIDDFNEIILKCGLSCKIHEYDSKEDYEFAGHIIKKENKHPLYQLNISNVSGIYLDKRFITIEKELVNTGYVYCLQTTHGNFYIEDKGMQYLTGNSFAVNPERACILVKELHWEGNNVMGKAKVLSTPKGELVKNLINDGVQLGVSSRGVGTLKNINGVAYVQEDYKIGAIDVVSNPSGPSCWVDGILENIEYYYDNGILQESTVEDFLKHKKTYNLKTIQEDLNKFISKIII